MKKLLAALLAVCFCGLAGCAKKAEYKVELYAMDTVMTLSAYGGQDAKNALADAAAEIMRLDNLFSASRADGEISRLNAAEGAAVEVSQDTAQVIAAAKAYTQLTDGAFDITIYPIVNAWGFVSKNYTVPDEKTVASLLRTTGANNIDLSGQTVVLKKGAQIGLGAIAKGYASDRVAELLRGSGLKSALVVLGGNVYAIGAHTDGSPWRIGIADPLDSVHSAAMLTVVDAAVVTSGGYHRYFVQDGVTYQHILDPRTGRPADNGLISVTIVSPSGTQADALSTALYVMGEKKALAYHKANPNFDYILITDDYRILVSAGLEDAFTLINTEYELCVID